MVKKFRTKVLFLGIVLDKMLTWKGHIDNTTRKCTSRMNLLKGVAGNKWGADKKVLIMYSEALIRPVLDNGCQAFGSASKTTRRHLELLQAQALRLACGAVFTSVMCAATSH
ncbi:unnamed protein product [Eretmochelys imbricata]